MERPRIQAALNVILLCLIKVTDSSPTSCDNTTCPDDVISWFDTIQNDTGLDTGIASACGSHGMQILIILSDPPEAGYPSIQGYADDDRCKVYESNQRYLVDIESFKSCGLSVSEGNLMAVLDVPVNSTYSTTEAVFCQIDSPLLYHLANESAIPTAEITLTHVDGSYVTRPVSLGTWVKLQIGAYLQEGSADLTVLVQRLTAMAASPDVMVHTGESVKILLGQDQDGCPTDVTVFPKPEVVGGDTSVVSSTFQAFRFAGYTSVLFIAEVAICRSSVTHCSQPACDGQNLVKRAADPGIYRIQASRLLQVEGVVPPGGCIRRKFSLWIALVVLGCLSMIVFFIAGILMIKTRKKQDPFLRVSPAPGYD